MQQWFPDGNTGDLDTINSHTQCLYTQILSEGRDLEILELFSLLESNYTSHCLRSDQWGERRGWEGEREGGRMSGVGGKRAVGRAGVEGKGAKGEAGGVEERWGGKERRGGVRGQPY